MKQPREWKMKRLEKRTSGTIRGATKRVGNEKPKRPKKPRKWTKKHMATRWQKTNPT